MANGAFERPIGRANDPSTRAPLADYRESERGGFIETNMQYTCRPGLDIATGRVADAVRCTKPGMVGRPRRGVIKQNRLLCAHKDCRTPEGVVRLVVCCDKCLQLHWEYAHPAKQIVKCTQAEADAWAVSQEQVSATTGARHDAMRATRHARWRTSPQLNPTTRRHACRHTGR